MSDIKKVVRCAVYCRKSHEEGLEQDYNSIDAQRDAGHAFIASQRSEGWIAVEHDYSDPAYSGGNMERPALKRLMADIEAKLVDVVVVYKIDRLTRSLFDFAQMVAVFERVGVSFVAVTQQFNTTTSMGRLMLNVLLSFAQFEREVTGERIRDKFAASKKKGIWMGGIPPLGYDVNNRKLVVNEKEAKLVRRIFDRFIALGGSTAVVRELKIEGLTTKSWTTQDGKHRAGVPVTKSLIYKLLANRTYLGELKHRQSWVKSEHPAIISETTFEQARAILNTNSRVRANHTRSQTHFLLKGMVFGADGRALSPWHSVKKNGRKYRYYIPQRDCKEGAGSSGQERVPAAELEATVMHQLQHLIRAPNLISEITARAKANDHELDEAKVTVALSQFEKVWTQLFPAEQTRIVHLLVERVIVSGDDIALEHRANGFEQLVRELTAETTQTTNA